jgi:hypothetical protein
VLEFKKPYKPTLQNGYGVSIPTTGDFTKWGILIYPTVKIEYPYIFTS